LLYDYFFIIANIALILLTVSIYVFNRYSVYLERNISQNISPDRDKIFNKINPKFHLLFKIILSGGLTFSVILLVAAILLNNHFTLANHLIKIDFLNFAFIAYQIVFSLSVIILIIFSLMYYRLKPDYRHQFIQGLSRVLFFIQLIGCIIGLFLYAVVTSNINMPTFLTYTPQQAVDFPYDLALLTYMPLLILLVLYFYSYRLFSGNRSLFTSKVYFVSYLLVFIALIILSGNFSLKFFKLLIPQATKHIVFHYSSGFAGLLWIYLVLMSLYSIIFTIFIFNNKDKFIGGQFAISYMLKLARVNFFSTMALGAISILPWILMEFYKYY